MSDYKVEVKNLDLFYGDFQALKKINFTAQANTVSA
ncbi:MAG: phosphate ABC transporter ATP-binding protein, partial [Bacteroidia bacterium]|nr:phosphate ABC transporter ATP-binding protein [Bacteroidia bacterium]